jgi:hypothetical protein
VASCSDRKGSTPPGGKRLDEEGMPCPHKITRL